MIMGIPKGGTHSIRDTGGGGQVQQIFILRTQKKTQAWNFT